MTQKLDVEEVIVTPKMATEMLERNSDNRKISWTHVTFLAKAMKRGEWKMTH